MSDTTPGVADLRPLDRAKEQKAWYWYDWANSAYVTTIAAVLFAPYLTSVAEVSACGKASSDDFDCDTPLSILGLDISAGSLVFYLVTAATILSALILPIVGAVADRSPRKTTMMARFAWAGAALAMLMFFVTGGNWQLGAVLLVGPRSASARAWSSTTPSSARSPSPTSAIASRRAAGRSATWVAESCWRPTSCC